MNCEFFKVGYRETGADGSRLVYFGFILDTPEVTVGAKVADVGELMGLPRVPAFLVDNSFDLLFKFLRGEREAGRVCTAANAIAEVLPTRDPVHLISQESILHDDATVLPLVLSSVEALLETFAAEHRARCVVIPQDFQFRLVHDQSNAVSESRSGGPLLQ